MKWLDAGLQQVCEIAPLFKWLGSSLSYSVAAIVSFFLMRLQVDTSLKSVYASVEVRVHAKVFVCYRTAL